MWQALVAYCLFITDKLFLHFFLYIYIYIQSLTAVDFW